MLNQALAIANGKGGVGKTSLTANVAAIAAQSGWEVLVVDLDPHLSGDDDLILAQLGFGRRRGSGAGGLRGDHSGRRSMGARRAHRVASMSARATS